ncbi:glycosyltransferase [Dysgonomonas sp. 216]|uniref:glycosyltransferase family 4 protein n=1 Tax=Dysgonomonas sp. 216 TaxID=2302934 RepID=UPI0013D1B349|nr:glycosyltransferase family 4 protein [Dysgonomonas sp. 216]NDW17367.1 glycosyltransferase [Dysgonomonas sp. 216]
MKIIVIGTRGIPDIQGGIETHCEKLYPILVSLGYDVTVVRRPNYLEKEKRISLFKGVKIKDIWAPRRKNIEAIIHTFFAVFYAKTQKPDILHIHAIGPSILAPLARLLGMKVIVTHHGPDYNRDKWGMFAKLMLRIGEKNAARYSNHIIAISNVIKKDLTEKYKRTKNVSLIPNGVNIPDIAQSTDYIESLGVEKHKYIFALGRFVKEKGFDNLVEAYAGIADKKGIKLVIAGDADHETEYSLSLKKYAKEQGVILTGFIKGEYLNELFSNAAFFVLPSFHEGLPISLLEAMSYNLDVVLSDILANRGILNDDNLFFEPGNVEQLRSKIEQKLEQPIMRITYDLSPYNWDHIAEQTRAVYDNFKKKDKI